MILEFTEDLLRKNIPATFAPVAGERTLVERLMPFLTDAASFMEGFIGDEIPQSAIDDRIFSESWFRAVALIALDNAIPTLDLILTPNGFATVGNSQVVPASAARTQSLRESCRRNAASAVQSMIRRLSINRDWLDTPAGKREASCLAVGLSFSYHGDPEWKLSEHQDTRARIMEDQDRLADRYFSRQLMAALAGEAHVVPQGLPKLRREVTESIAVALRRIVMLQFYPHDVLLDLAGTVNSFPDIFPEYVGTAAQDLLFNPVNYENRKNSSGFFF